MSDRKSSSATQKLKSELEEMETLAKRVQADFQNYRRRSEEERSLVRGVAREEVIRKLLPVIDNFERALGQAENVPEGLRGNEWVKGILAIEQQFKTLLGELGVERIEAVGEQFDASCHEAIAQSDDQQKGDGQITEEFESGWRLGDRVIRPAKVRVNTLGETTSSPNEKDNGEEEHDG